MKLNLGADRVAEQERHAPLGVGGYLSRVNREITMALDFCFNSADPESRMNAAWNFWCG